VKTLLFIQPRTVAVILGWLRVVSGLADGRKMTCRRGPDIYFFCSIGAPQHLIAPAPPLVTITWEEHLPQI
jgi:hypothetical protein